jgi:hypothetical protein
MRDIQEKRLPHPFAPLLQSLGMAGGTKPSGLAGKHQQMLGPAARTPDPGKAAAGVAAIQIALDDVFYDGSEITIVPLEPALVFRDEPFEIMKNHPVEGSTFRMTRAIDSRHIGMKESRNAPEAKKGRTSEMAGQFF